MAQLKKMDYYPPINRALLIDHSAGKGGRNRKDDVLLVQFLLNVANRRDVSPFYKALKEPLVIDGVCGKNTKDAILLYQKKDAELVDNLVVDGVVNATDRLGFRRGGALHGTTISNLNWDFWNYLPEVRQDISQMFIEPLKTVIFPLRALLP
jgi:hypothetical protein